MATDSQIEARLANGRFGLVPYDVIRIVVGAILGAAALLKFSQLYSGRDSGGVLSPELAIFLASSEIILSVFLLLGVLQLASWRAAVVMFSIFLAASLYSTVRGYEACDCFGAITLQPWQSLAIDVVVLVALRIFTPKSGSKNRLDKLALPVFGCTLMAISIAAGIIDWRLREPLGLTLAQNHYDFGTLEPASSNIALIQIKNTDKQILTIREIDPSCFCTSADVDKRRLMPGESATLKLTIKLKRPSVEKSGRVLLYYTAPNSPERAVSLSIRAKTQAG